MSPHTAKHICNSYKLTRNPKMATKPERFHSGRSHGFIKKMIKEIQKSEAPNTFEN